MSAPESDDSSSTATSGEGESHADPSEEFKASGEAPPESGGQTETKAGSSDDISGGAGTAQSSLELGSPSGEGEITNVAGTVSPSDLVAQGNLQDGTETEGTGRGGPTPLFLGGQRFASSQNRNRGWQAQFSGLAEGSVDSQAETQQGGADGQDRTPLPAGLADTQQGGAPRGLQDADLRTPHHRILASQWPTDTVDDFTAHVPLGVFGESTVIPSDVRAMIGRELSEISQPTIMSEILRLLNFSAACATRSRT